MCHVLALSLKGTGKVALTVCQSLFVAYTILQLRKGIFSLQGIWMSHKTPGFKKKNELMMLSFCNVAESRTQF